MEDSREALHPKAPQLGTSSRAAGTRGTRANFYSLPTLPSNSHTPSPLTGELGVWGSFCKAVSLAQPSSGFERCHERSLCPLSLAEVQMGSWGCTRTGQQPPKMHSKNHPQKEPGRQVQHPPLSYGSAQRPWTNPHHRGGTERGRSKPKGTQRGSEPRLPGSEDVC